MCFVCLIVFYVPACRKTSGDICDSLLLRRLSLTRLVMQWNTLASSICTSLWDRSSTRSCTRSCPPTTDRRNVGLQTQTNQIKRLKKYFFSNKIYSFFMLYKITYFAVGSKKKLQSWVIFGVQVNYIMWPSLQYCFTSREENVLEYLSSVQLMIVGLGSS